MDLTRAHVNTLEELERKPWSLWLTASSLMNLPFYYHIHLDRFNRGSSFVMDPLVDRHYLVSLWPIPGPDTSATHRSETDIAVLKYLEEGLTVGLNSVVLSQKTTVGELQLLKSHKCGSEVIVCQGFSFADLKNMHRKYIDSLF